MNVFDDVIPKCLKADFIELFVEIDIVPLLMGSRNLVFVRRWIDGLKLEVIE